MIKLGVTVLRSKRLAMVKAACLLGVGAAAVAAMTARADAETLQQALISAYGGNPTLNADRARQRATDEQVPQALSGWRPTVEVNGSYGYTDTDTTTALGMSSNGSTDPGNFSITLTQPLFRGFKTVNSTRQAEANVDAGRESLRGTEQNVLLNGVVAFMNVIQDRQIVDLRRKNVEVLREQLRATQARFNVGEVTRTDVAQSRARLSESLSALSVAQANLAASVANYVRVIGHSPDGLVFPSLPEHLIPKTLKSAIAAGDANNPDVGVASFTEEASRYAVEVARGDLLPQVSLQAEYSWSHEPSLSVDKSESTSILGAVTMPLYQGGAVYSQVRQAKQTNSQRRIQILEARRAAREAVVQAWNNLDAARQTIVSTTEQVRAQELAYEGVKQEAEVGTRTTLDVLNAEQELVNARVSVVTARRDRIVAAYQLIAAMGRLNVQQLSLPVAPYNPDVNYQNVRYKLFGTGIGGTE
ncbi:TolC family outer membrane protein [Kaustia mangrovi]|uniref:TolC family outer membrane protein n=1 Tax=Kaustia mangrovi TaxID=2593653 RepID=A0A7S8C1K8_9HYPH|nr:TolC family outer membrane protein [Kaustia mangrovi]QPC41695.1 TolC family outer membrane protein [Kaustia mangrovi]